MILKFRIPTEYYLMFDCGYFFSLCFMNVYVFLYEKDKVCFYAKTILSDSVFFFIIKAKYKHFRLYPANL